MINLIAAITYFPREDEFIIAVDGDLPHTCPEDMKRFKKLTTGGVVIMGRKTYETLGKPLPDRINVVLSTTERTPPPGALLSSSLEDALKFAELQHPDKEVWIIGGGQVYSEAIKKDYLDCLYISEMKEHYEEAVQLDSDSRVMFGGDETVVVNFPRVNMANYKAIYIEQFDDHSLKILSKQSLVVL